MKRTLKILIQAHKILGLLLSLVFLIWFLSGFVLIFTGRFPRIDELERISKQQEINTISNGGLQESAALRERFPDNIRFLALDMLFDRPVIHVGKGMQEELLYADTLLPVEIPLNDEEIIKKTVAQWCAAPVKTRELLHEVDQWTPLSSIKAELPLYKYRFADQDQHELYISAKTGRVVQYTNKKQRFWAWLGAIPHWTYFTFLRQNQQIWALCIQWATGIGCVVCLSGLLIALHLLWKNRETRRKVFQKNPWYRRHYLSGLLFCLPTLTFTFSGMMSLTDLPAWMKKQAAHQPSVEVMRRPEPWGKFRKEPIQLEAFKLDYRNIIRTHPGVKRIEWEMWHGLPYFRVFWNNRVVHIDAAQDASTRPFVLSAERIRGIVEKMYGGKYDYTVELLEKYDDDYFSRKKERVPLPVYRVIIADELHTRIYFNPETLKQLQYDDNTRLRSFLFRGLHCLHFKCLIDRPLLWYLVMFIFLGGGIYLSLTSVVLTGKWIARRRPGLRMPLIDGFGKRKRARSISF